MNNKNDNQDNNKNEEDSRPFKFTFMNKEWRCYCCGQKGHKSPQCKYKDIIPKEKWAIRLAKDDEKTSKKNENGNELNENAKRYKKKVGWANAHILTNLNQKMKKQVILDSGSSTSVFCEEKYCDDIAATNPIEIKTNGGSIIMKQKCCVPDLGNAYFSKKSLTNIIGLRDMRTRYRVIYDSDKEPAFLIHTKKGIIKF